MSEYLNKVVALEKRVKAEDEKIVAQADRLSVQERKIGHLSESCGDLRAIRDQFLNNYRVNHLGVSYRVTKSSIMSGNKIAFLTHNYLA